MEKREKAITTTNMKKKTNNFVFVVVVLLLIVVLFKYRLSTVTNYYHCVGACAFASGRATTYI